MAKKIKFLIVGFIIYYLAGLVLGFVGLQLSCYKDPLLYSCWSIGKYVSDPWLFSNTLFWPFIFLDLIS